MKIEATDSAWAAGLFDGDGCIRIAKRVQPHATGHTMPGARRV